MLLQVAIVSSHEETQSGEPKLREIQKALRGKLAERGWQVREFRTHKESSPQVGTLPYLSNSDANALIKAVHRGRVAVVSLQRPSSAGPVILRRPPMKGRLVGRDDCVSLREFCRHKAFFVRLRWDREPLAWLTPFQTWAASLDPTDEGHRDPRCLPLHVFFPEKVRNRALLSAQGRTLFRQVYGVPDSRVDERDREWNINGPETWHGHETLQRLGKELPRGFHWDVQGRNVRIETLTDVYEILVYANVTPDGQLVNPRPQYVRRLPLK